MPHIPKPRCLPLRETATSQQAGAIAKQADQNQCGDRYDLCTYTVTGSPGNWLPRFEDWVSWEANPRRVRIVGGAASDARVNLGEFHDTR